MPAPTFLLKGPNETKTFIMDFADSLATSETIASGVVVSSDAGITLSSPTVVGTTLHTQILGGSASTVYGATLRVYTSNSNIFEQAMEISVHPIGWMIEMVTMLRFMINDVDSPQTYSDARLAQTICMAAQYVQQEISFLPNIYTISVSQLSISPDPTTLATPDVIFTNFSVLRAACFIDQSALRTRAALANLKATLGPLSLDTANSLQGYIKVLENGPCKSYNELKLQYGFGNAAIVHAVVSPFVNNKFDPRILGSYMDRAHGQWSPNSDGGFYQ